MPVTKFKIKDPPETSEFHEATTGPVQAEIAVGMEAVQRKLEQIKRLNQDRRAQFTYHAYSNPRFGWTREALDILVSHAALNGFGLALWENTVSAMQLVVIRDPDVTEDSGFALYERMHGKYQAYGMAHWTEWVAYGVEIDPRESFMAGNEPGIWVFTATDGDQVILH